MDSLRNVSLVCLFATLSATLASCGKPAQLESSEADGKDAQWIDRLLADQRSGSKTKIAAVEYKGQLAFLVLPEDRVPDSGNEHILYDINGDVICEFGGVVGRVASGSCDIEKIEFRKQLFPK